jgi:thioredoxin reductase (NADPH)
MTRTELLVVGAGPAGLTAGIYGSRSGRQTTVVERAFAGGQMALTSDVENYPGFAEPVTGLELAQTMERQARRLGCSFASDTALGIRGTEAGFELTGTSDRYSASSIIICSGATPRRLGVPGEKELTGRGVSYCAVCDGPLFRGREVAVIGGGDSALDEALYLTGISGRVHIVHRRDEFRGCRQALERLRRRDNVVFHLSTTVAAMSGQTRLEQLELRHVRTGATSSLPVSGVFVYVGLVPNTQWCHEFVELDPSGAVRTDDRLQTSVPGVYAAGDVRSTHLRQIATAVGDGALAAMMAGTYISSRSS